MSAARPTVHLTSQACSSLSQCGATNNYETSHFGLATCQVHATPQQHWLLTSQGGRPACLGTQQERERHPLWVSELPRQATPRQGPRDTCHLHPLHFHNPLPVISAVQQQLNAPRICTKKTATTQVHQQAELKATRTGRRGRVARPWGDTAKSHTNAKT